MGEAIRLVIWDLDETFWRGTLSEGGITEFIEYHHDLVKELTSRGIVNSICSKNDLEQAKAILSEAGLWEYFIFPSIDWTPKGERVRQIIEDVQLRPETVLFIDDNSSNLAEAKAAVPGLQVADKRQIRALLGDPRAIGKDDRGHSRLQQYKLLETRSAKKRTARDNTAFLRESGIVVAIEHDIARHIDRAIELINRTNQLNFTKVRLPEDPERAKEELMQVLSEYDVRGGLLSVKDKFGDYGFVGIYLMKWVWGHTQLIQFAFSCRILGMGIEQWLYSKLGKPRITVMGAVASALEIGEEPDWIDVAGPMQSSGECASFTEALRANDVRLRGGCELEILEHIFRLTHRSVHSEVIFSVGQRAVYPSHSAHLVQALQPESAAALREAEKIGFRANDLRSNFFDRCEDGTLLIYSPSSDGIWGFGYYKHKTVPLRVPVFYPNLGAATSSPDVEAIKAQIERAKFTADEEREFFATRAILDRDYEYIRSNNKSAFENLYRIIIDRVPTNALLVIILPNHAFLDDTGKLIENEQQKIYNNLWRREAAGKANVMTLDMRDFIVKDEEVRGWWHHFDRSVFPRMYLKLCSVHQEWLAARAHDAPGVQIMRWIASCLGRARIRVGVI